jgi:metalloprotease
MKCNVHSIFLVAALAVTANVANAQIKIGKPKLNSQAIGAATSGAKAIAFSNEDAIKISKQAVEWMDTHNPVAEADDPYAIRLTKLFANHKTEDGLELNFKVYKVVDINAFACADGSVRVFSSLMDILTDAEILAVIGHEIGHVKNEDTKDAIKSAYMRVAVKDAAASQSGAARTLSESELGDFAEGFLGASHSRKQESDADSYSYDFLKKHNYDVIGAYTAFKKLALLSGGADNQTKSQKMMSSHPDSEARAAEVKKRAEKDGVWKDPGEVKLPTVRLEQ